ncbi:ferritin-like domain-containing protein [Streptomyces sp. NPDC057638]|uniref:ferritin-like domain-containing protein n=1 Tax=Streptomyces sp. NPDC057638 TaxID=3346190 RepID=UPI0036C9B6E5
MRRLWRWIAIALGDAEKRLGLGLSLMRVRHAEHTEHAAYPQHAARAENASYAEYAEEWRRNLAEETRQFQVYEELYTRSGRDPDGPGPGDAGFGRSPEDPHPGDLPGSGEPDPYGDDDTGSGYPDGYTYGSGYDTAGYGYEAAARCGEGPRYWEEARYWAGSPYAEEARYGNPYPEDGRYWEDSPYWGESQCWEGPRYRDEPLDGNTS